MSHAVFTQGSVMKHIMTMTLSSTIGLLSLFMVDLVDMYFLSLLGQQASQYCTHTTIFAFLLTGGITIPVWLYTNELLSFLGASGATLDLAVQYIA